MAFAQLGGKVFVGGRQQAKGRRSVCKAVRSVDVAVVGAGLSGLSAAKHLLRQDPSLDVLVVEASDAVGGRVRTDIHPAGFVLDRGFQVMLEGYPEFQSLDLDFEALQLARFRPGALVRAKDGEFARVGDPLRDPGSLLDTVSSPVGSAWDKGKVGLMRASAPLTSFDSIMENKNEMDTLTYLTDKVGLTSSIIDSFFRPFYQGIFLSELSLQSSTNFDFVFKVLADGNISLPALGLQAIPEQIASSLPDGAVQLKTRIKKIIPEKTQLIVDGTNEVIKSEAIVVAVEGPNVQSLLPQLELPPLREARGTICFYFARAGYPCETLRQPLLVLNGDPDDGPVNNMFCASSVAESYAPAGSSLISTTVIGSSEQSEQQLESDIRRQMSRWFGDEEVSKWKTLRSYKIPYSQPAQTPPNTVYRNPQVTPSVYICGDHWATPTVNGALKSGRLASEAIIRQFSR